ncbi:hypothetical protein BJF83_20620 [Nocardiopsis sp. CNR-923]|uniref:hypothetical protein n=1 Tax=Nocardiopsis sp. CNR-923 TaxID=1904965 RepID=UPI000960B3D1|nr:hypothetical protein [Nocardiopsis sp. CNR-923]OLT26630.1 hypothetical protein BJF83_20620 [Nocardiopsis sp. CNR-923]
MRRRTVRRIAAAVVAAPVLALAAPAVASADHWDGRYGRYGQTSGAFWSYNQNFAGGFGAGSTSIVSQAGSGGYRGGGNFYGGALYSQSGSFAGPSGAASYDIFSFAR